MEVRIQSIHFDATERLKAFIEKKVGKLEKFHENIKAAEVVLKVVKPETALNKEAGIMLLIPSGELYAEKTRNSFEEAVAEALEALEKQLQKFKEKQLSK